MRPGRKWLVVITLLVHACRSPGGPRPIEVAYRTIVDGALSGTPSSSPRCRVDEAHSFRYQFPLGDERTFEASDRPLATLSLRSGGVVSLIKAPVPRKKLSLVVAEYVFPSDASRETTLAALSSETRGLFDCDLLITIGGESVGVIWRGSVVSTKGISIGIYPTYEAAESILAGSGVQIERTVPDPETVRRDEELAELLERLKDWSFQCDEKWREEIRTFHPTEFEELVRRPKLDCTVGPPDPP